MEIIDFAPQYAEDFKRLNVAWISHYFTVEPHDLEQLDDPITHIIEPGGYILMAKLDDQIVGTVALVPTGPQVFELAKMAVDSNFQGQQIGKRLGEAVVARAKALDGVEVWLESNRRLTPALSLYERLGFVEVPMVETPYARADIRMSLLLNH